MIAASPSATPVSSPDLESNINQGRGGGQPLPSALRSFFEPRFGRDFSGVRVHTGTVARKMNEELQARAFTYGTGIWLGKGETVSASATMAHELAHVVQQTSPRTIQTVRRRQPRETSPPVIQRKLYWEPPGWNGAKTHAEVLKLVRGANGGNIFVEAPIPNATRNATGGGVGPGFADLLNVSGNGKRALGVIFDGQQQALRLQAPGATDNPGYNHTRSAPLGHSDHSITNISLGASTIKIADLKPKPASPSGNRGKTQINNYIKGIEHARGLTNKWAVANKKSEWQLTSADFWTGISLPSLNDAKFQNQTIVIKEFTWKQLDNGKQIFIPSKNMYPHPAGAEIKGHLVLDQQAGSGIIHYRWKPSFPYKPATLTGPVKDLEARYVKPLLKDLHTIEVKRVQKKSLKEKPLADPLPDTSIRPVLRRKTGVTKEQDKFDLEAWNRQRQEFIGKYAPLRKQAPVADRSFIAQAIDADKDAGSPDNINSQMAVVGDLANIHYIERLDLWTSAKAAVLGKLRQVFGRTFVAAANLVHRASERIRKVFERAGQNPSPTSYAKVAVRAIWRAAKAIAKPMFQQTMAVLSESLRQGVMKKLKEYLPFDNMDSFKAAVTDEFPLFKEINTTLEGVKAQIDSGIKELETRFAGVLGPLKALTEKAETVGTIIKVAMVAVQCASPPIIGCLKLLASSLIARLADKILSWCPIQEKFQELAMGVDFFRKLPKKLAGMFIDAMPKPIQSWFDESVLNTVGEAIKVAPECSSRGVRAMTPEHEAIAQLMTDLGCEEDLMSDGCQKFKALAEVLENQKLHARKMTVEEIKALGPLLNNKGFSAQDLKDAARWGGEGKVVSVQDFLKMLPELVKKSRGRKGYWQAMGKFGEAKGELRRLSAGKGIFNPGAFTPQAMARRKIIGVAYALKTAKQQLLMGTVDVEITGSFNCLSPTKITALMTLRNVRLSDEQGKQTGDFGLEGMGATLTHTRPAKVMKSYQKLLCPP